MQRKKRSLRRVRPVRPKPVVPEKPKRRKRRVRISATAGMREKVVTAIKTEGGSMSTTAIARQIGVSPPVAKRVVKKLAQQGVVTANGGKRPKWKLGPVPDTLIEKVQVQEVQIGQLRKIGSEDAARTAHSGSTVSSNSALETLAQQVNDLAGRLQSTSTALLAALKKQKDLRAKLKAALEE